MGRGANQVNFKKYPPDKIVVLVTPVKKFSSPLPPNWIKTTIEEVRENGLNLQRVKQGHQMWFESSKKSPEGMRKEKLDHRRLFPK